MNRVVAVRRRWLVGIGLAIVAGGMCVVASVALANGADSRSAKKQRTGEQLFAINCSRCHDARYAPERTDAQWKSIVIHMRTRARIPADDAKKILEYLQANN